MVTIIKKGANKQEIANAFANLTNRKKFDAYKYSGTLKLKGDPLTIQKKMRDEWQ